MKIKTTTFLLLAAAAIGAVWYFSNDRNTNPYHLPTDVMDNLKNAVPGSDFLMLSSDGKTYKGIVSKDHYLESFTVV